MTPLSLPAAASPFLADYLGPWMIADDRGASILAGINRMDMAAHIAASQRAPITAESYAPQIAMDGNIAVMEVRGAFTKYGSSLSSAPASLLMQRAFRRLEQDDAVAGLLIVGDSPGGQAAGTGDAADALARLNAAKPVVVCIEDIGASAMYYLASQATRVSASPNAVVGSIGTYMVLYDSSAALARDGYKALVIRAGEFKGMGADGTEITPAQQAEFQRYITSSNNQFKAAVQRGRRLTAEQTDTLADGRVHIAADALKLGLIDAIETPEQAMQALRQLIGTKKLSTTHPIPSRAQSGAGATPLKQEASMSEQTKETVTDPKTTAPPVPTVPPATPAATAPATPVVATAAELRAALPGSTAEFREECQVKGMTLAQAKDAHMTNLAEANQKLDAANKELQAKAPANKGNQPLGNASKNAGKASEEGDPVQTWNIRIAELTKSGMSRAQATSQLVKSDPELHASYLGAINPGKEHLVTDRVGR